MDAILQLADFLKDEFPDQWSVVIEGKRPPIKFTGAREITIERIKRAETENISLAPASHGRTISVKGGKYTIDVRSLTCTCPDFQSHNVYCKHLIKAAMEHSELGRLDEITRQL